MSKAAGLVLLLIGLVQSQPGPEPIDCPTGPVGECINQRLPYEYDCRYYWVCNEFYNCSSILFRCPFDDDPPSETWFHSIVQECVEPEESDCDDTEPPDPTDVVMFFAALTSDWSGANEQIIFDVVPVNVGEAIHDNTNFIAESTGIHFFSISAAFGAGLPVDVQMYSEPELPGAIYSNSTAHTGLDMIYRDVIAELTVGQTVKVNSFTDLASDEMMQTSWTGFSLDDFMMNIVAFSVVRETPLYAELEPMNIPFETVMLDVGGVWNSTASFFTAPIDGIYYFSFSTGQIPDYECHVAQLADSGLYPQSQAELWKGIGNNNGYDMHSRAVAIPMAAGDRSWMALYEAGYLYSDMDHHQFTFSGFLYNPSRNPAICWSVHRLSSWDNPAAGPLDPVIFEEQTVNEWDIYDVNTGRVTIPITGYYFIQFNIGVEIGRPLDVALFSSNDTMELRLVDATKESVSHQGIDNVGRSLLWHFKQGDQLRLVAEQDTAIHSTRERQTSWLGLLLYAWPPWIPTTPEPTVTTPPITDPTDVDGFWVALGDGTNDTFAGSFAGPVEWDEIFVNMGPTFESPSTYVPNRAGLHFFSMAAGVAGGSMVDCHMTVNGMRDPYTSIYRMSTIHDDSDIVTRNSILQLNPGDRVTFDTQYPLVSDDGYQTSWVGFNLNDFFTNVVAFYVARDSGLDVQDRVYMTHELVDTGDNFNMTGGAFVAPVSGYYYLSYSAGYPANQGSRVGMRKWIDEYPESHVELWKRDTAHDDLDMSSKVFLVHLEAGNTTWLAQMEGHLFSDPTHYQISWLGFMYDPVHVTTPTAWSLSRDRTWQGEFGIDPLPWEYEDVDTHDAFNPDNNTVTIPVSGWYYMEFNFGVVNAIGCKVTLHLGGEPDENDDSPFLGEVVSEVVRESRAHNAVDSLGLSLMRHFLAGDVLRFRTSAGTSVFSDRDRGTTWIGMLMYEDSI